MPPVIAVAGKGGSGKTTLSALLVRCLLDMELKPVLAVDADPNTNLGEALGIDVQVTLGGTVEDFQQNRAKVPPGMTKEALVEMRFASIIEEQKGFDLLSMGRGEGPGCYCSVNNVLRMLVEKLTGSYKFVVIDNEAGLEDLSRGTARHIDGPPMGSAFAGGGIRAAQRGPALGRERGPGAGPPAAVVSRAPASVLDGGEGQEALDKLFEAAGGVDLELAGVVPHDEDLVEADLTQGSVLDLESSSTSLRAVRSILDKVLEKTGAN